MRIRSVAAIAVAALLSGALVAGPAHSAQTITVKPEVFAGGASARALDINVLGQRLTFGDTFASAVKGVNDKGLETLLAKATGAGQLSLIGNTTQSAEVSSPGSQSNPEKCAGVALPAAVSNILNIGVACSASSASVSPGGLLNALSSGNVAGIDLSANTVLSTLPIGTLADTLLAAVPDLPIDVKTPVKELVDSVLKTKTLDVSVGDAVSSVTSTADTVTASANSAAVTIKLLPTPDLKGVIQSQPILTITAAQASAKAVYDRLSGKLVDASFDPALVRIKCTLAVLCNGLAEIVVAPGQDIEIGKPGDLLHVRIAVASGKIIDDPVLGKKAVSDGVAIQLLDGLSGGIQLNLAHAEAGAIGTPAQTKVLDIPTVVDISRSTPQLPRTGAEDALPLAIAAVAIVALAGRRLRSAVR
jgi:hypothetical protein